MSKQIVSKKEPLLRISGRKNREEGYALLEYVMGAALVLGAAAAALTALGISFSGFFNNLSGWISSRSSFGGTGTP